MKTILYLSPIILGLIGCTSTDNKSNENESNTISIDTIVVIKQHQVEIDTTPRVTGIGGIFFFTSDVDKTKEWYETNLGLQTNPWGASFEFRNANDPNEINYLQWSPFIDGNSYFTPSQKDFMINYRVYNIEALVANMKANGVTIVDSIETYDYGKFVHIMDNDGNKIELWEPVDSVFTEMDGPTNK